MQNTKIACGGKKGKEQQNAIYGSATFAGGSRRQYIRVRCFSHISLHFMCRTEGFSVIHTFMYKYQSNLQRTASLSCVYVCAIFPRTALNITRPALPVQLPTNVRITPYCPS